MSLQIRLKNSNDDRFYSPDRDLAYCAPYLYQRAFKGLHPDNQEPWIKDYCEMHNITQQQLIEGALVFATYLNELSLDPNIKNPYDGLIKAGFFDLPQPIQTIICAKFGQVFISASFFCVRDGLGSPDAKPVIMEAIVNEVENTLKEIKNRSYINKTVRKVRNWFTGLFNK